MSKERTHAKRLLIEFLQDAFSVGDLRKWATLELDDDGAAVPVPEGPMTAADLAHALVDELVRRRLVNNSFFGKLVEARRNRRDEIAGIAAAWDDTRRAVTKAADLASKNFGTPDLFKLLIKAAGDDFVKSTKAMEVAGGCLVQVSTRERSLDGTWSVAEALSFVPNSRIAEKVVDGQVVARWLEAATP